MKRKDKKTTRRVLVCTHIHVHSHGMYAVDIVYIVEVESSTSFKNIFYRFTFFKDAVCVCAQQYYCTGSACVTSYIYHAWYSGTCHVHGLFYLTVVYYLVPEHLERHVCVPSYY